MKLQLWTMAGCSSQESPPHWQEWTRLIHSIRIHHTDTTSSAEAAKSRENQSKLSKTMGTFPQSEGGQVCKTIVTSAIQGPIAPVLDNLHAQTEKKKYLRSSLSLHPPPPSLSPLHPSFPSFPVSLSPPLPFSLLLLSNPPPSTYFLSLLSNGLESFKLDMTLEF